MRIFILLMLSPVLGFCQSSYIGINSLSSEYVDRLDILSPLALPIHTSVKGYNRKEVAAQAILVDNSKRLRTKKLKRDLVYLFDENNEWLDIDTAEYEVAYTGDFQKVYADTTELFYTLKEEQVIVDNRKARKTERDPVLGYFYKSRANFFEFDTKYLSMKLNPILNINFGKDSEDPNTLLQNTRGIEVRGNIDEKVYFYTSLLENQGSFKNFIEDRINQFKAIPGFGSYKSYQSTVVDNFNGYDFPNSQAYVGVKVSKHIGVELGHGRHFIGNGYQSLLLSDYANNYFYLKFNTKVWKLHYQNIFAELNPIGATQNPGNTLLSKKYMATHYLSIKPSKNIEIGLFETVLFSRENTFELQYLNPVIFYRTIEFFLDSPDNVILGVNAKWNVVSGISLYGQFVLDEFKLGPLKEGTGWWANKYGLQMGLKYLNVLKVDHLDLQAEYNVVRPYTYSHRTPVENFPNSSLANYSHQNQPLAHPLGANFKELIGIIKYRPVAHLHLRLKLMIADYGDSTDGLNWGNNVLIPHGTRVMDLGNEIGQGVSNTVTSLAFDASYEFYHNYFLDFNVLNRSRDSEDDNFDINTRYIGGGIRANISNFKIDY